MKKRIQILLLFVMLVGMTTGCTSEGEEKCKLAVDDFLTKFQQLDPSAGGYVTEHADNRQLEFKGVQAIVASRISHKIKDSNETENGCTVTVVITAPDFRSVFEAISSEYQETDTEDDVLNKLQIKLNADNVPMRSFTVDVFVREIHGSNQILMTSELVNALSGGYHEYVYSLVEELLNG